jgi:hypothetical protein
MKPKGKNISHLSKDFLSPGPWPSLPLRKGLLDLTCGMEMAISSVEEK